MLDSLNDYSCDQRRNRSDLDDFKVLNIGSGVRGEGGANSMKYQWNLQKSTIAGKMGHSDGIRSSPSCAGAVRQHCIFLIYFFSVILNLLKFDIIYISFKRMLQSIHKYTCIFFNALIVEYGQN